ncbi:het-domain-containing [Trichoderma cornu-damae]|uniref:Het-domain-containing n=1 Tax=Trichoderma cornu-damae TaxID=654480 RepID=A0A9P8TVW8_9HYPO|nr:het-domain-containing [Trichoderma cornu-damae]
MDSKRLRDANLDDVGDVGSSNDKLDEANKRRKRQKTNQEDAEICQECTLLDIDNCFLEASDAFKRARKGKIKRPSKLYGGRGGGPLFYTDAFFAHSFGDRLSEDASCPLCRFFWSMRIQADRHHEKYKLLAFCSSESCMFSLSGLKKSPAWKKARDTVWMGVVPDTPSIPPSGHGEHWLDKEIPTVGPIYLLRPDEVNRQVPALLEARQLSDGVDFAAAQEWFSFCREWHLSSCSRPDMGDTITRGFRVIDCERDTPAVVEMPWGVEYAALSYVWGQRPEDLVDWPATVLDAAAVSRKLGLRYLWVDRLCINQSDPAEKEYLISRMTTIYEYAELTIVSAAGSGASDGLPGVRSTRRKRQPKILLTSGSLLVSAHRDPRQEILASEYWTRGWTYQEGVLSNRRLVFTENQAYWECRCMATQESLRMPLELVHRNHVALGHTTKSRRREIPPPTPHGQHMEDYVLGGIFKSETSVGVYSDDDHQDVVQTDEHRLEYGFPTPGEASTGSQLRALNDHIRAFSTRKLSHDGDSLKAFLGIAGMYRDKRLCIYLGIPMWMDDILGDLTGPHITFALSVCSWYHRSGTEHQMFIAEPCHRRTHLPSWTWAGWQGTISWRAPPSDEHCVFMRDLITAEPLQVHLVWAADLYLRSACEPVCLRLLNLYSADVLEAQVPTLLEIRNPLVLKYSIRHEVRGSWEWRRLAGRAGEARRYQAERQEWDKKWYRIGGRLACVTMSIPIAEEEWTRKHDAGELISVLIFAAQRPRSEHGRARFLTLQRVESDSFEARWERVGTLQLTIPEVDLDRCLTNEQFLGRIPVREWGGAVVVR